MGFKKNEKQINRSNQLFFLPLEKGGLIFDLFDYLIISDLDKKIKDVVKTIENGSSSSLEEYFNKIPRINVKEKYYNAREEMDGLFKNATQLLCYEGTRFDTDYKVGCCFFDKINIIEYCDSDSDDF